MNRWHRSFSNLGSSRHIAILCLVTAICVSCSGGGSSNNASTSGGSGGSGAGSPSGSGGSGGSGSSGGTAAAATDVLTYHNDLARTGQYLAETTLTPANVNATSFGKVGFLSVDGKVDAQPLYASNVSMNGAAHNVVYVVTEHASVYAFDADSNAQLWQRSLLGTGETTSDPRNCAQISPEIGITATPVIDRGRGTNGVMYAVAMSKDGGGTIHQRLHAIDLATGAEVFGGPTEIAGSYPGSGANSSNGVTVFDPQQYAERQALTLVNGNVYLAWTSHCDQGVYAGWVMAYNADTLAQTVSVPAGCTASVSFFIHIDTSETTTTTQFDKLTVALINGTTTTTLRTFSNLNHATGYTQVTLPLSGVAGSSVTIKFTGTEDSSLQTSFVVDDTAFNVS